MQYVGSKSISKWPNIKVEIQFKIKDLNAKYTHTKSNIVLIIFFDVAKVASIAKEIVF
jgi:hypothetical protein